MTDRNNRRALNDVLRAPRRQAEQIPPDERRCIEKRFADAAKRAEAVAEGRRDPFYTP